MLRLADVFVRPEHALFVGRGLGLVFNDSGTDGKVDDLLPTFGSHIAPSGHRRGYRGIGKFKNIIGKLIFVIEPVATECGLGSFGIRAEESTAARNVRDAEVYNPVLTKVDPRGSTCSLSVFSSHLSTKGRLR